MLIDARKLDSGRSLQADLCVVGAGPAGLAIAKRFLNSGQSVILLESGGFGLETEVQELYRGKVAGGFFQEDFPYLKSTRLRLFGGTSNHWGGWCRPLDPMDFEQRDWVPNSGWPISYRDLEPYDSFVQEFIGIAPLQESDEGLPLGKGSGLLTRPLHIKPTRFGKSYAKELAESINISVVIHANVTELVAGNSVAHIESLKVATLSGSTFHVSARKFVVACGAVENARLLLCSDRQQPGGLGNAHDVVGRYFMEHANALKPGALGVTTNLDRPINDFKTRDWKEKGYRRSWLFNFSNNVQREKLLYNSGFAVYQVPPHKRTEIFDSVGKFFHAVDNINRKAPDAGPQFVKMHISPEFQPDIENRISLISDRDRLNMRKVQLNWKATTRDRANIDSSFEVLSRLWPHTGFGRIQLLAPLNTSYGDYTYKSHHIGTTRMHQDVKRGVVDGDCRVHGLDNLYISGSSVFTTSGYANPTYTILSLAARLADHLKQELSS